MGCCSEKKRVLITGGAGFLGSHLIEKILSRGDHVICMDNLFTGTKSNIERFLTNPNFELIVQDIIEPIDLEVDEIHNLACPASPICYQEDPIKTVKTNVLGAVNVLELALKCGAPILQASTSEIYGDPGVHPQPEAYWGNVNPIGIRSCYDEGKRCAETLFFDYHRQHGIEIKVARVFNTYGPGMKLNDGRVVSNFIVQALMNDEITIYGNGQQTRSFCYVDDLIDGFLRLANSKRLASDPKPVNLGNPNEFTIYELAETVISLTGSSSKIISLPLPLDDPRQRQPDISQARELLDGWEPKIQLRDGLEKTIKFFESSLRKNLLNV